jgi:hypothetical protein
LIAIRTHDVRSRADVVSMNAAVAAIIASAAGSITICADHRLLRVLSEDAASALLDGLRQVNTKIVRSALLLPRHDPGLRLQIERLLREAQSTSRRICLDAADVRAWLHPCLDAASQVAVQAFLSV